MAKYPSAFDIQFFGQGSVSAGIESPAEEAKRVVSEENRVQAEALYGTAEAQRVLATTQQQGTMLGKDQGLLDITGLDSAEFGLKYGNDAALARGGYSEALRKLTTFKQRERSLGEATTDTAISAGMAAAGIAGSVAQVGAIALDQVAAAPARAINNMADMELLSEPPALSPYVAEAVQGMEAAGRGQQSDLLNARREQGALEAELMAQDRAILAEQDKASGDGDVVNWFKDQGRAFYDTIRNYGDDPMLLGDKIPEGIGSVAGFAGLIRSAGKAALKAELRAAGRTDEGITTFLKTAEGKKMLAAKSEAVAPAVIGGVESGSAGGATQNMIMGMDESDLSESQDYLDLREQGLSHEEAQNRLARDAGAMAAVLAAPGAILAGRIAAPFAANPLAAAGLGAAVGGVARETVEEAIQGGNAPLAQNAAQNAVGIDTPWDQGVAEGVAEGVVSGVTSAGPLQAAGLTGSTARAGAKSAVDTVTARVAATSAQIDQNSPVGLAARTALIEPTVVAGGKLVESLQGSVGETTEQEVAPKQAEAKIVNDALFLDEADTAAYGAEFTAEERTPDGRITRQAFIEKRAQGLKAEQPQARVMAAVDIISSLNTMRKLEADVLDEATTSEEDRANLAQVKETLSVLESSEVRKAAVEEIQKLTQEDVRKLLPLDMLKDPAAPAEAKKSILDVMEILTTANPSLLTQEEYGVVLNQVSPEQAKTIEGSRAMAELMEDSDAAKAEIMAALKESAGRVFRPSSLVREDILVDGNKQNSLPSIVGHRQIIGDAVRSGRMKDAKDALFDLKMFAQTQINKMGAYNKAVQDDVSDSKKSVPYEAYGPFAEYLRANGAWFQKKSPASVALVRDIYADTQTVVNAYNNMLAEFPQLDVEAKPMAAPMLNPKVLGYVSNPTEGEVAPAKERRMRKNAMLKIKESLVEYEGSKADTKPKQSKAPRIAPPSKRPFTKTLIGMVGGIEPDGYVGEMLKAAGMTSQNSPGVFKKGGRDRLDNVVASEAGEYAFLVEQDGNGYLNEDDVVATLIDEFGGTPLQDSEQMERQAVADAREAKAKAKREAAAEQANVQAQEAEPQAEEAQESDPEGQEEGQGELQGSEESAPAGDQLSDGDLVADEPPVAAEPASVSWFNDLKKRVEGTFKSGLNYFVLAFKPSKNGSTFTKHSVPSAFLLNSLDQITLGQDKLSRKLFAEEKAELTEMLTDGLPKFRQVLNGMLRDTIVNKKLNERDAEGKNVRSYGNAQVLNFLVMDQNGKRVLDNHVVEAAFMAVSEWLMENAQKGKPRLSTEQVSKIYGLGRNGYITPEMAKHAAAGVPMQSAIKDVAKKIETLLGVKANGDMSASRTQGIITSLAATALEITEKQGKMEPKSENYQDKDGNTKTLKVLSASKEFRDSAAVKNMKMARDIFTQTFTPYRTKARYIGAPPSEVARTQLDNPLANLSKLERKVVERLQNVPHRLDMGMLELMELMGEATFKRLMGYTDVSEENTHISTAESREGKNQSLDFAWDEIMGYVEEIRALGGDPKDTSVFFGYEVSVVGRLQQQGRITPQGSKEAREVITSTWSTVDLSNADQDRVFWLAVAQSLGVGIEKQPHAKTLAEIQARFNNELSSAVGALQEWIKTGKLNTQDFVDAVQGIEMTPKVLHALMTVAQADLVRGTEAEKTFETSLAIEADGKTDGPINAMIHMMTGRFDAEQVKRLAKGGLFFTSKKMSLSQFMAEEQRISNEKHKDLYATAAEVFRDLLGSTYWASDNKENMGVTLTFLNNFLPGFTAGETAEGKMDFEIERGVVKNPLTVFLYGSGVKGIGGKIANAALAEVYQRITDNLEGKRAEAFSDAELENLTQMLGSNFIDRLMEKATKAVLTLEEFLELQDAIVANFAEPMLLAVDQATGGLAENMKELQAASQMQTVLFQAKLMSVMASKKAEHIKEGKLLATEELSENDMNEVFTSVMRLAPIYKTNAQEFHIAKRKWVIAMKEGKNGSEDRDVSASLSGAYTTSLEILSGSDASVKISPYMTIGTGDGRMIMNIFEAGLAVLRNALPVFDGVEQGIAEALEASQHINASVFKGWMDSNIYESVAEGFEQLLSELSQKDLDALPADVVKDIALALGQKPWFKPTVQNFKDVQQSLVVKGRSVAARKAAMNQITTQTDHMAGAEVPSANGEVKTTSDDPTDYQAIADKLNELADAARTSAAEARQIEREKPTVQAPTEALKAMVQSVGEAVEGYPNVRRLTGGQLVAFLKKGQDLSRSQIVVLRSILDKEGLADSTYYFGTEKDLTEMRGDLYPEIQGRIQLGQYATHAGGVTFITNTAPETVLHEMLHSHTYRVLRDYYRNPEGAPAHVKAAVKELEKLMKLTRNMAYVDPALETLKNELRGLEGKPAEQMTEFLSWTLANQKLIELGKRKRIFAGLADTVKKTLDGLKKLLGIKQGAGETLFSNIRFNAEILVSQSPTDAAASAQAAVETEAVLNQVYPTTMDVMEVEERFGKRLLAYLDATRPPATASPADVSRFAAEVARKKRAAHVAAEAAKAHGFAMTAREQAAFESVYEAMESGMHLDAGLLRKANTLYGQTVKATLKEDFLKAMGVPGSSDPLKNAQAQAKLDFLIDGTQIRQGGQSDLLASFVALGLVNEEFQKVLAEVAVPKALEIKRDSFDGLVRSLGNALVQLLTTLSFKQARLSGTAQAELSYLAARLSQAQVERKTLAADYISQRVDAGNDWAAGKMNQGTKASLAWLERQEKKTGNKYVKGIIGIGDLVLSLGSKEAAAGSGEFLQRLLNAAPGLHAARALLNDLQGMTASNKDLLRLINPARASIDAVRQDFREKIPEELARQFSRKLDATEWDAMFQGLAKTDLLALGRRRAANILKAKGGVAAEITRLEADLAKQAPKFHKRYAPKIEALATYLASGKVTSNNLHRNAHAIARLLGEQNNKRVEIEAEATTTVEKLIDELVSLKAYDKQSAETKASIEALLGSETEGMARLMGFLYETRRAENDRLTQGGQTNTVAQNNGWKGYIPALVAEGAKIIVADASEDKRWVLQGYVRVGQYYGDPREGYRGKRYYYQSTVGGQNTFRQGIAQTIHETWNGVDARTGQSRMGSTTGMLMGTRAWRIAKSVYTGSQNGSVQDESLMPVFDALGNITAYERALDPAKMAGLQRDTHLGRMLGVWAGRITEETVAEQFNRDLLDTLKKIYDAQRTERGAEFVNVADPKQGDATIKDAWDTLGWRIKKDAEAIFGKDFLPVRADMVNDAIGYRAPGIADLWTGVSRWSPETQRKVRETLIGIGGVNTFKRLRQAENIVTDLVSYAKTTVVVRSVVVAMDNILGNMIHLGTHGIGPIKAAKGLREKFIEITQYVQSREEIGSLKIELASLAGNSAEARKVNARIAALEKAIEKLSIMPLIRAGEFSTISENLTEADVAIREGKWGDYIEQAVEKLPGPLVTVAKNFAITKDTALFQGLNRMIQYGDFVAKAVLYDHLMAKGKNERDVLDTLFEEFVPYNRLAGRSREGIESMGLLWFWNYKLRIQKVVVNAIRERPFNALALMGGVGPATGIDTPWSGSLLGAWLDGKLPYAVGPEMGFNAPGMNPWYGVWDWIKK